MAVSEVEQFDRRARRGERRLVAAFDRYVSMLVDAAGFTVVLEAVRTGLTGPLVSAIQAVRAPAFDLLEPAVAEARATLRLVEAPAHVELVFDVRDPRFEAAVYAHQARLVREVSAVTREAIAHTVADAYRRGLHPYDFAPRIRATVGLTTRQSMAVMNRSRALAKTSMPRERVTAETVKYAERLRRHRAVTIARTETIRAANTGRIHGFRQAAWAGLVSPDAKLVWDATLDRRVCPVCASLEGKETTLEGGDFDGVGQPPAHPLCRCTVQLHD